MGNVLYYCTSTQMVTKTCTGTKVCGWSPTPAYYDCVAPPATADPNTNFPLMCP